MSLDEQRTYYIAPKTPERAKNTNWPFFIQNLNNNMR